MAEEISGEEHRARLTKQRSQRPEVSTKLLGLAVVGLVLLGLSFRGGVEYQKHQVATPAASRPLGQGRSGTGFSGRARGQRPDFGQVTAVSPTSITITARSGSTLTLAITASTTVTNNGQAATISDISVGDTVAIVPDGSNSAQASRILLNPTFGGASTSSGAVTN